MAAIDPLANPKGVVRLCELCQKPAYIQCCQCRVTFYWFAAKYRHYHRRHRRRQTIKLKLQTRSYCWV